MIDERTGLEIIEEDECWELLASKQVGRIATSIANRPDVFPVNFKLDGKEVVIYTVPGTKLAAAVLGPGVAFEVDDLDEGNSLGWSVVARGRGTEVEKLEDLMHVETLGIRPWTDSPKFRYLRISIDEISGRRVPSR
jgi:nitroimidazol reductase NimA-like FMN-containing flavoprotein (pyridoxamine 5'-phosphate oxidase superfamily)